jgi:hypothetical protein
VGTSWAAYFTHVRFGKGEQETGRKPPRLLPIFTTARLARSGRSSTCWSRHDLWPTEVSTDRGLAYLRALDDLVFIACHVVQKTRTTPSNPTTVA